MKPMISPNPQAISRLLSGWIFLPALCWLLAAGVCSAQNAAANRIEVIPDTMTVEIDDVFTLKIEVTTEELLDFAAIHLTFDPALLQLTGWQLPDTPALPDDLLGPETALGQLIFEAGSGLGNPPVTGSFELIELEFKALAASPGTALSFDLAPYKTRLLTYRDFQVLDVLEEAKPGIIVIEEGLSDPCETSDLAATAVASGPLCGPEGRGAIDLTVSGGLEPYAFNWSNGATTEDVSDLPAGAYGATITDGNGCTTVVVAELTLADPIVLMAQPTSPSCSDAGADGAIDLTVSGGTAPYTIQWSTGAEGEELTGLAVGDYQVTVTDALGCTASETIAVPAPAPFTCSVTLDSPTTDGLNKGRATVVPAGGTAPYTYQWDNGETTVTAIQLSAGLHAVTVTDVNGCSTTCQVNVIVEGGIDYELIFSGNDEVACLDGSPGVVANAFGMACDSLVISSDTIRLEPAGGACLRLAIIQRVINWCEYDGVSAEPTLIPDDWDGDGDRTEAHFLRIASSPVQDLVPEEPGIQVVTWTQEDGDRRYLTEEEYEALTPGFWEFTRVLSIFDENSPQVSIEEEVLEFCTDEAGGARCDEAEVSLTVALTDDCTQDAVELRGIRLDIGNDGAPVDGTGSLYSVTALGGQRYRFNGKLPPGLHALLVSCVDACGNATVQSFLFRVRDCTAPQPLCLNSTSIDLQPLDSDGDEVYDDIAAVVTAAELLAEPEEDCPGSTGLRYHLLKGSQVEGDIEDLSPADLMALPDTLRFTCADNDTQIIYLVAMDAAGNWGYCASVASISQPADSLNCENFFVAPNIQGMVRNEEGAPIEDVMVALEGQQAQQQRTGPGGSFSFRDLQKGGAYLLTPQLDEAPLNGVSTFDIVQISKHILGVESLDSPYKMIAADANRSGSISTLDLIQIRKLILLLNPRFPDNTSWRFVPADFEFIDSGNPFFGGFPEEKSFESMDQPEEVDFIGIKIGDVNISANTATLTEVDPRSSNGALHLHVSDRRLAAGVSEVVEVRADQLHTIEGMQFTLSVDPEKAVLEAVLPGLLSKQHMHVNNAGRELVVSWDAFSSRPSVDTLPLFSLVLRAEGPVSPAAALSIRSTPVAAEAYTPAGAYWDVLLRFSPQPAADGAKQQPFILDQNFPNPFSDRTTIGFELFRSAEAILTVRTSTGREVYLDKGIFPPGKNAFQVPGNALPENGLLIYTLQVDGVVAGKKMIRVASE